MPTAAGKALFARCEAAVAELEARLFSMLDTGEKETLLGILRKISAEFQACPAPAMRKMHRSLVQSADEIALCRRRLPLVAGDQADGAQGVPRE